MMGTGISVTYGRPGLNEPFFSISLRLALSSAFEKLLFRLISSKIIAPNFKL